MLELGELEDGRHALKGRCHTGNVIWSSQVYHIHESLMQKNQPILYWILDADGNSLERFFVREELMTISSDTEYSS